MRRNTNHRNRKTGIGPALGVLFGLGVAWRLAGGVAPGAVTSRPAPWRNIFAVLTPAYAAAPVFAGDNPVVIENFDDVPVGGFPPRWKAWRGDTKKAYKLYSVQEENGNRYLQAHDDGTSIIIRKELPEWNPKEYPILSWRWRARVLPKGGDERIGSKNDSAVAIYVVLSQNFIHIPKTLKYVWSTTLPVGTRHRRKGIGRPNVIVLQSGPEHLGEWTSESVNVYEDYVRTFGKNPPSHAVGIGVLTDGNATKSDAAGDYDDLIIYRRREGS